MNKRIDFTNLGGFPATQETFDFMQTSFRNAFASLAKMIGDKVIVEGCEIAGGNVSNGWISVNGELLPFIGSAYNVGDSVVIVETQTPATFEDNVSRNVYFERKAQIGAPGGFLFSDLVRLDSLKDTYNTLVQLLLDFAAHTHAWADITGKPSGYITHRGSINIGDVGVAGSMTINDSLITVNIPDQGGVDYTVGGSIVGQSATPNNDNDVMWTIHNKTSNSFQMALREVSTIVQNVRFEYFIVKSS